MLFSNVISFWALAVLHQLHHSSPLLIPFILQRSAKWFTPILNLPNTCKFKL